MPPAMCAAHALLALSKYDNNTPALDVLSQAEIIVAEFKNRTGCSGFPTDTLRLVCQSLGLNFSRIDQFYADYKDTKLRHIVNKSGLLPSIPSVPCVIVDDEHAGVIVGGPNKYTRKLTYTQVYNALFKFAQPDKALPLPQNKGNTDVVKKGKFRKVSAPVVRSKKPKVTIIVKILQTIFKYRPGSPKFLALPKSCDQDADVALQCFDYMHFHTCFLSRFPKICSRRQVLMLSGLLKRKSYFHEQTVASSSVCYRVVQEHVEGFVNGWSWQKETLKVKGFNPAIIAKNVNDCLWPSIVSCYTQSESSVCEKKTEDAQTMVVRPGRNYVSRFVDTEIHGKLSVNCLKLLDSQQFPLPKDKVAAGAGRNHGGHPNLRTCINELYVQNLNIMFGLIRRHDIPVFHVISLGDKYAQTARLLDDMLRVNLSDLISQQYVNDAAAVAFFNQARFYRDGDVQKCSSPYRTAITFIGLVINSGDGQMIGALTNSFESAAQKFKHVVLHSVRPDVVNYDKNYHSQNHPDDSVSTRSRTQHNGLAGHVVYKGTIQEYEDLLRGNFRYQHPNDAVNQLTSILLKDTENLDENQFAGNKYSHRQFKVFYLMNDVHYYLHGWKPLFQCADMFISGGEFPILPGCYDLPFGEGKLVVKGDRRGNSSILMQPRASGNTYEHDNVYFSSHNVCINFGWYKMFSKQCLGNEFELFRPVLPRNFFIDCSVQATFLARELSTDSIRKNRQFNGPYETNNRKQWTPADTQLFVRALENGPLSLEYVQNVHQLLAYAQSVDRDSTGKMNKLDIDYVAAPGLAKYIFRIGGNTVKTNFFDDGVKPAITTWQKVCTTLRLQTIENEEYFEGIKPEFIGRAYVNGHKDL